VQANSFNVVQKRKRITIFKLRGHFVFRHYFDDKEIFRELADHYDRSNYRFEFKTPAERNKALSFWREGASTWIWWRTQKGTW
jgi:hypothetical protein